MKFNKIMSFISASILTLSIATGFSYITTNAQTITDTNSNPKFTTYSTDSNIAKMQAEIHKKTRGKTVSVSNQYIKIENISNDPQKPKYVAKAYTEKEYLAEKNLIKPLTSVTTPYSQYNWITLTLEVDKSYKNDGTYEIYGFYSWKTLPFFTGKDFIALTHDSNITFNPQQTKGSINYDTYLSNGDVATSTNPFNNNSSDFTYAGGNVGYRFQLHDGTNQTDYGFIGTTGARPTSSSSNIVFTYEHQGLSITWNPTLSFPGGVSVSVNAIGAYTPANIGIQARF